MVQINLPEKSKIQKGKYFKDKTNSKNIRKVNLCGVKGIAAISWIKKNGPSINTGPFKF